MEHVLAPEFRKPVPPVRMLPVATAQMRPELRPTLFVGSLSPFKLGLQEMPFTISALEELVCG